MLDFEPKDNYDFSDFIKLIAFLRSEKGCPWDREQTHESIKMNLLEEAYELYEALEGVDEEHLIEELGDLLMQVLFHSRIAEESGRFNIDTVSDAACKKLVHRHPHVFSNINVNDSDEVLQNWDNIKRRDRGQQKEHSAMSGISSALPALMRAQKIQSRAGKIGFDWPDVQGAFSKLEEEVSELKDGMDNNDRENIAEELGDIIFSAVNVARFYDLDTEELVLKSCEKFIKRFEYMEEKAESKGIKLGELSLSEMEEIYQQGRQELEGKEPQYHNF